MSREEILKKVINILSIQTGYEVIEEKDSLRDDLNMDSLDELESVIMIEKHFAIYIPDARIEKSIKNVTSVVDIIEELLKAKNN